MWGSSASYAYASSGKLKAMLFSPFVILSALMQIFDYLSKKIVVR
jgi:hypothetical protein